MTRAAGGRGDPELAERDALVTDRYLETLLAAHARGADHGPLAADRAPDPAVRWAADQLASLLPRLHPSFRFEEALALRLQEAAARMRLPLAAGAEGTVAPLPAREPLAGRDDREEDGEAPFGPFGPFARTLYGRPLLIGGALTSAALSLAGAAYLAWRLRHPQAGPMARAVRAVARGRLA